MSDVPPRPPVGPPVSPPPQSSASPSEGLPYHRIHRGSPRSPSLSLLGVAVMLIATFVILPLIGGAVVGGFLVARFGPQEGAERLMELVDVSTATPSTLAFLLGLLAISLFTAWFAQFVVTGLRPRWLSSVVGGLRWRWLLLSVVPALLALIVALVLGAFLPVADADAAAEVVGPNPFTSTMRDLVLVVVLIVPFQAAAEEYIFRGYLTQAVGGILPRRLPDTVVVAAAVLVPALIFTLFHGVGQSLPVFFDRFAFGVAAGLLTILTGGLEAAISYHVLNNLLAFGVAIFFGDIDEALNPTGGSWVAMVVSLVRTVVYVVVAVALARKIGLLTRTATPVLVGPRARV